ncbi:ATP-binding protein [Egicoccus halophilus]|uniref:ATPase n=1 Tax=Egicoccus halophilus TaxID=1670830 RepID=A0A8J3AAH7_9ACTN|nr:ATP-binding protein [Egicoccus halophilus]GGI02987.1 ATPase [Egicoccus halophilus]
MPNPFEDVTEGGALDPAANPFRPGMGRVPPDFGGREPALRRAKVVVDRLSRPAAPQLVLYRGVRGVGKTALLAYVRQQAERRGVLTLALEADRGDTDLVAARETLRRGAAPLVERADEAVLRRCGSLRLGRNGQVEAAKTGTSAATVERLIADLGFLAAQLGQGILLTVDEVQEAEQTLLKPLLRAAHLASQEDRPLGVLLSGLPSAAETLFDEGQTYTERLERLELGLLDRAGTVEAIRRPFEREADVLVDEHVLDHVHDESGGYPWFVQLWGAALWDSARDASRVDLVDARVAGVEVHERVQAFFADRWRRVPTGRGALLTVALAEQGGDAEMGDLTEVLDLTHQALSPARRELVERGLCWAPARGRLAFTVPGFADWVARTRPDRA